jgi:hypothetical protein
LSDGGGEGLTGVVQRYRAIIQTSGEVYQNRVGSERKLSLTYFIPRLALFTGTGRPEPLHSLRGDPLALAGIRNVS